MSDRFHINDRVEGGIRGTEDHDTGRVTAVDGDQVTVSWDSLVETTQRSDWLRLEGEEDHRAMAMNDTVTLSGLDAIAYAEANDMTMTKAADPTEGAREGVSVDEAREIARQDSSLLSLDLPWHTVRQHIVGLRDEAVEAGDDDQVESCDGALAGDEDEVARCMAVICEALGQR